MFSSSHLLGGETYACRRPERREQASRPTPCMLPPGAAEDRLIPDASTQLSPEIIQSKAWMSKRTRNYQNQEFMVDLKLGEPCGSVGNKQCPVAPHLFCLYIYRSANSLKVSHHHIHFELSRSLQSFATSILF